jgi:hypothetical protein
MGEKPATMDLVANVIIFILQLFADKYVRAWNNVGLNISKIN